MENAKAEGITVISYDRLITDTEAVDYYVTFDSVAVGEAMGQYLVDNAEGQGNSLYLYAGAQTDNNAFLFFEGAWERAPAQDCGRHLRHPQLFRSHRRAGTRASSPR